MLSHYILVDYSGLLYKPSGTGLSQVSPNFHTFCLSQVAAGTNHFLLRPISSRLSKEKKNKKTKGFGSVTRAIERQTKWKGLILKMFLTMSEPIPNGVKQDKHSLRDLRSVTNSQGTLRSLTLPSVSHSFLRYIMGSRRRICLSITHPLSYRGW